jgi:hypothetical protein
MSLSTCHVCNSVFALLPIDSCIYHHILVVFYCQVIMLCSSVYVWMNSFPTISNVISPRIRLTLGPTRYRYINPVQWTFRVRDYTWRSWVFWTVSEEAEEFFPTYGSCAHSSNGTTCIPGSCLGVSYGPTTIPCLCISNATTAIPRSYPGLSNAPTGVPENCPGISNPTVGLPATLGAQQMN